MQHELHQNFAENSLAVKELQFSPAIDINAGLKSVWDWTLKNYKK